MNEDNISAYRFYTLYKFILSVVYCPKMFPVSGM